MRLFKYTLFFTEMQYLSKINSLKIKHIILYLLTSTKFLWYTVNAEEGQLPALSSNRISFGTSLLLSSRVRPLNIPSVDLTRSKRCDDGNLICQQPHTHPLLISKRRPYVVHEATHSLAWGGISGG